MFKLEPKHMWMSLPVVLLMMSVSIGTTGFILASRGNDAEVERDYYSRAVNWDKHQALVAASIALGWKVQVTPATLTTAEPIAAQVIEVTLDLVDREGVGIEGAKGAIEAFQVAHRDHTIESSLVDLGAGLYRVSILPKYSGRWLWNVRFELADDVFIDDIREDILFAQKSAKPEDT